MVSLSGIVAILVGCLAAVSASPAALRRHKGPEDNENTYISLINGTPYRWRKNYSHSYQVYGWERQWPDFMLPGESVTMYAQVPEGSFHRIDSAAETTYSLEGTNEPMSLQVQFRSGYKHNVHVQFLENLETLNNAKNTDHFLGFLRTPGGVGFLLAGTEGDFISNDGPLAWMQSQLHEMGNLTLREISLPRSHNAGQWQSRGLQGVATDRNTQTQVSPLYDQLGNGGIRVIDLRPCLRHHRFHAHHGSLVGSTFHGMRGASLQDMMDMQNKFMDDHPGELFIWDIHEGDARDGDHGWRALDTAGRAELYRELSLLNHRAVLAPDTDITTLPLSDFISPSRRRRGESSVIIRVPAAWAAVDEAFPGPQHGFVSEEFMPLKSRWSNTNKMDALVRDQIAHLRGNRPSPTAEMYHMQWILNQKGLQVVFTPPYESIIQLAGAAWKTLYGPLWDALTDQTYPSWIGMDNIHGSQHKALAMAINKCFAAKRCGALGGKVAGVGNDTMVVST